MTRIPRVDVGMASLIFLGASVLPSSGCSKEAEQDKVTIAVRFDTGWKELGVLHLRYESEDSDAILLRHLTTAEDRDLRYAEFGHVSAQAPASTPQPVYRFTPKATRLDRAEEDAWDRATGKVVDCEVQRPAVSPFEFDERTDTLKYAGAIFRTRGRTVQSIIGSPDGKWVAVLSVDGKRLPSFAPAMMGRGRVEGTRYHQVFSRANGTQVGETVALPFDATHDTFKPCWSADARYLVYTHTSFRDLAIIKGPGAIVEKSHD